MNNQITHTTHTSFIMGKTKKLKIKMVACNLKCYVFVSVCAWDLIFKMAGLIKINSSLVLEFYVLLKNCGRVQYVK